MIIAHGFHMAMLRVSQQISGAANFQIPHGDFKSAAKLRIFLDCGQTLFGSFF